MAPEVANDTLLQYLAGGQYAAGTGIFGFDIGWLWLVGPIALFTFVLLTASLMDKYSRFHKTS